MRVGVTGWRWYGLRWLAAWAYLCGALVSVLTLGTVWPAWVLRVEARFLREPPPGQ